MKKWPKLTKKSEILAFGKEKAIIHWHCPRCLAENTAQGRTYCIRCGCDYTLISYGNRAVSRTSHIKPPVFHRKQGGGYMKLQEQDLIIGWFMGFVSALVGILVWRTLN